MDEATCCCTTNLLLKHNKFFLLRILRIRNGILSYQFFQETCITCWKQLLMMMRHYKYPNSNKSGDANDFDDLIINNWIRCDITGRIIEDGTS